MFSRLNSDEFNCIVYHLFGDGTFRKAFEDAGVHVVNINANGNFDIRAFSRFVCRLRADSPDVLHTHSPISGLWGRPAAHIVGINNIISTEHNVHDGYPLPHRLANGLTLPLADSVVANSAATARSLRWWERPLLRAAGTQIETIPNGIELERFETATADGTPNMPDSPLVGTLGTHDEQKGFDVLLDALSLLDGPHEPYATIIGDGPAHDDLRAFASHRGLDDRVDFPGRVPSVPPYLAAFDIAVFPSRWEGFGLVAAEAMATGTPVVASDIPAFREVVGDAGVLVTPEDPAALAEGIDKLLNNPNHRASLATQGLKRVRERFSVEHVAEQYADLYRTFAAM